MLSAVWRSVSETCQCGAAFAVEVEETGVLAPNLAKEELERWRRAHTASCDFASASYGPVFAERDASDQARADAGEAKRLKAKALRDAKKAAGTEARMSGPHKGKSLDARSLRVQALYAPTPLDIPKQPYTSRTKYS